MIKKNTAGGKLSAFTTPPSVPQAINPMEKAKLDAGVLGNFFGTSENASNNIIGITALLTLLIIMIIAIFIQEALVSCLSYLSPILTTILGYLMGSKLKTK